MNVDQGWPESDDTHLLNIHAYSGYHVRTKLVTVISTHSLHGLYIRILDVDPPGKIS